MEIAVVARGRTVILRDLGSGTSTDAEWLALIHALEVAKALGLSDFVLIGDSADVVAKANGVVKCRGASVRHHERFRALASSVSLPRVRHIKRSHNLAGIALARLHSR
ncbi:reverse transcriptase-like protein [Sphingomonas sp.]|uniref:reverse transcriptase-like protein n=1 Tax=Sphingomonas sp. TaxID=28214 RepID=UPI003B3A88DD